MSDPKRKPITMQGLVDDAAEGPSKRDQVIKIAGAEAAPYLDAFEKGAQDAGIDLYEERTVDQIVQMYNRAHSEANEKLASAGNTQGEETDMAGTTELVGPEYTAGGDAADIIGPEGGHSKLAADKLAEAQAYGAAVGQAQAEAFFDTMQKLAADDGLYKLAQFSEEDLDALASHHAHDLLVFTGRTTAEKVASVEQLEDGRVAVIDMPLDEEVMAHVAEGAFQKIASKWGDAEAEKIRDELIAMYNEAAAAEQQGA